MFSGTVSIVTKMAEAGVTFPPFDYNCGHSCVTKCELATDDGHEIRATVTLKNVPTAHGVEDTALMVHKQAMRRLECLYGMTSGDSRCEVRDLRSQSNPNDCILVARGMVMKMTCGNVSVIVGRSPDELRDILERELSVADIYFEQFNHAKTSSNHVAEFLGYYQIMLSILDDEQAKVDEFILDQDPQTPQTQKPDRKPGALETVYTRLRNEIAHVRRDPGTDQPKDISKTKTEIAEHVRRLRHLAAIAIKTVF